MDIRMSFGFICTEEELLAVQRRPTPEEQKVIDEYRAQYEKATGRAARGLHYLVFPGVKDDVAVWLPISKPS